MISNLDTNQQFIFDQIKYGLANNPSPEPLTDVDVERLSWPADAYSKIPAQEWNEWSRKIHWALQYAFSHDTSRLENKERLEVWRRKCMAVVRSALAKGDKGQTILESSAFYFVQQDLLHHLVDIYGFKNLTDEESEMVSVLSGAPRHAGRKGCFGTVLVLISVIGVVVFLILKL